MPYTGLATAGDIVALPEGLLQVYSLDIQHEALGIMRFMDFAVEETDLTKVPGESITFTRYANLTLGGRLTESVVMVPQNTAASQRAITVTEWGNAVGATEKLLQLSWDEQLAEMAILLGRDYAIVLDLELRNSLCGLDTHAGVANVLYGGDATSTATLAAGDVLTVELVRQITETLSTQNAPKFMGEFYICFVHPHQGTQLKRDPEWIAAQNYNGTRRLFNGEIGMIDDIVFIGTTHMPNGAAAAADPGYEVTLDNVAVGGLDVYQAVAFGDGCLGFASALPVEMRENGIQDFGRQHAIAWYAILGADTLFDNYGVSIYTV